MNTNDILIKGTGTAISGSYKTDAQTHLTVGKPNYGNKYFGRFKMDNLVIWLRQLTQQNIANLFHGGNGGASKFHIES